VTEVFLLILSCPQAQAPGDAQLSAFANDKWEQLLLFLVGAGDALKPEHGSTCVWLSFTST